MKFGRAPTMHAKWIFAKIVSPFPCGSLLLVSIEAASVNAAFMDAAVLYGMPRTMGGPIQRVSGTGSRCQMRMSRSYLPLSKRMSLTVPSRT